MNVWNVFPLSYVMFYYNVEKYYIARKLGGWEAGKLGGWEAGKLGGWEVNGGQYE